MTGMDHRGRANGIGQSVGGQRGRPSCSCGYPQTGQMWRKIAPKLLDRFSVVCPDLRGYGDSDKPRDGYDKKTMARDVHEVMLALGYTSYALVGHDRGGRVAHRLALDYPGAVTRLCVLDIVPTHTVFARTDRHLAAAYWHWFFFQAPDLPELMIAAAPEPFLRGMFRGLTFRAGAIEEAMVQEYLRAFTLQGTIRAGLEDYRAAQLAISGTTSATSVNACVARCSPFGGSARCTLSTWSPPGRNAPTRSRAIRCLAVTSSRKKPPRSCWRTCGLSCVDERLEFNPTRTDQP